MAENTPNGNWLDWMKDNVFWLAAMVITAFKLIDKWFEHQSKKDKEHIKEIVKECLETIKEEIIEIKDKSSKDYERISEKINEIYKFIK